MGVTLKLIVSMRRKLDLWYREGGSTFNLPTLVDHRRGVWLRFVLPVTRRENKVARSALTPPTHALAFTLARRQPTSIISTIAIAEVVNQG